MIGLDKLLHAGLCFVVALFSWSHAVAVGLIIELAQAEVGALGLRDFYGRLYTRGTLLDLVADAVGVVLALVVRALVFNC